ncbi:MAG: hypothetical protein B7Y36_06540 [Novosphingobium sp. 28-62-57]|uniref:O-antigen ligase family protein n=1 Tax=unclassified Novosphingobium TaxID=2644732 RepID=UPI000BD6170B|nr:MULTISPECIES: O-antigen ligase family protein [unclassified Novosphingobium]OYW48291.1 MAG: hypothetical protein B7Z34_14475 [Novosphingobium sp. 12-62-10]OYZ11781.1 MAG: hypothetical protein B7Y36_06540 [Novosphingobium sp. 28-62-57]OZA36033.1 MAG: hypothetical protein B7X92_08030 [Novosphingobium sp. 17-62-9]
MHKNSGVIVLVLILVACLFGGGGVAFGVSNLAVQIVAISALALNGDAVWQFISRGPRPLVALVACSLLLPLVQLIPLPPEVWRNLPGRGLVVEALSASGQEAWRPLTVSTARTFVAFTGLIAPFAVIVFGWRSSHHALQRVVVATVGVGFASILLGAFQVLGQDQFGLLYPQNEMPGVLFGFFANRNSTAVFLVSCLLLLCSLPSLRPLSPRWLAKVVAAVLLVTGVILTQSRTGLVLLALPLGMVALQSLVRWKERGARAQPSNLPMKAAVLAVALIAIGGGALATLPATVSGSRIETLMARFDKAEEQRPAIWEDARFAAERYWPAGSGMGTFDEVFQIDESLENISPRRAGRAHNDYIELAIEAGPFALLIVLAWATWTLWSLWRGLSSAGPQRWHTLASAGVLLAVALQSLLDYPLRNQTMLCLVAFAVVLLARQGRTAEPVSSAKAEGELA